MRPGQGMIDRASAKIIDRRPSPIPEGLPGAAPPPVSQTEVVPDPRFLKIEPWRLKQPDILAALQAEHRQVLLNHAKRLRFQKGAVLYNQGDPTGTCYIIEQGRLRTYYISPIGREITVGYWSPGDFIGAPDMLSGGSRVLSAAAVDDSTVLAISETDLCQAVRRAPEIGLKFMAALSFKVRWSMQFVEMMALGSVEARLALLLRNLIRLYGAPGAQGFLIQRRFTHQELAEMVGCSRQWVTVSLNRLEDQGVISTRRSFITILNPEALARLVLAEQESAR
jgi:CRP-like cAMP-binding protein